jgi:uncharacterized protein (DUF849 family)
MVAPNGARKTKADHPALPIGPEEVAQATAACRAAGAAAIHLHVRDDAGAHSLDTGRYRDAIAAIRARVGDGMIIQVTTEAVGRYRPEEQMTLVRELQPEAVSLAVRELVPDAAAESAAARFLAWLARETAILPQFIVYDADDLRRFNGLRDRGVVPDGPAFLLFVLGRYTAGQVSDPRDLLPFLAAVDPSDLWATCAFGPREGAVALTAAALGGHSRLGFENNTKMADGTAAPDNAALIAQTAGALGLTGRRPATAEESRELLNHYRLVR